MIISFCMSGLLSLFIFGKINWKYFMLRLIVPMLSFAREMGFAYQEIYKKKINNKYINE